MPGDLDVVHVTAVRDTWVARFQHHYAGFPVLRSHVAFVYKLGRLVLIYGESYPVAQVELPAILTPGDAEAVAASALNLGPPGPISPDHTHALIFPVVPGNVGPQPPISYRLAYEVHQYRQPLPGEPARYYVSYVDARDGRLLEIQDGNKYQCSYQGTVTSRVDQRTAGNTRITVANKENKVEIQNNPS